MLRERLTTHMPTDRRHCERHENRTLYSVPSTTRLRLAARVPRALPLQRLLAQFAGPNADNL